MTANKSVAHRLGGVLEKVTRQSGRLPDTPEYGSWLLGKASESQLRRRVRIQVILTVFLLSANLLGIAAAILLVIVVFPVPSIFSDAPKWITFVVTPAYIALALVVGIFSITHRTVNAFVDDALRATGSRVHSSVRVFARLLRCRDGHPVLPADRIRVASGRGASAGSRTPAAPAERGDHGPDHDRVATQLRGISGRDRAHRGVRLIARQPHRDPVRLCRNNSGHVGLIRRLPVDVDPVLADGNASARGARCPQTRRARRPGLQRGGVRRQRTRRAATWLQLDGRRSS
jgi:hypothetical protein